MRLLVAAWLAFSCCTAFALEVIPDNQWFTTPNVVLFQKFAEVSGPVSVADYSVQLTNLNKNVNSWYLLGLTANGRWRKSYVFNLENPMPEDQKLGLSENGQLLITNRLGQTVNCDLIGSDGVNGPVWDALGRDPYMPLCNGRVYLRNKSNGRKDAISWATTGLRDIFGDAGDKVVNLVKEEIYDGKFFEAGSETRAVSSGRAVDEGGPDPAKVSDDILISKHGIGIALEDKISALNIGQWYKSAHFDGVYVSVMKAKYVDAEILKSFRDRVKPLESNGGGEGDALVDSVAIDISKYRFGWTNGTEHPGVGWSSRANNPHVQPGPDGFATVEPLVLPGVLSPMDASQAVAVLTGGFQRHHSAFRAGPLTRVNRSHHYGFMEKGVEMSTLVPNLASFIVYIDGTIDLKTWTLADTARLDTVRDVRQNGVPLIENGEPTVFVNQWAAGNWSGSADAELKTPRTSACLVKKGDKKWLIVSYFTTHTPSGMARVLQSYGCDYAIHLDMNHPRFAYTAFFTNTKDGDFNIEHLSNSMVDDVIVNGKRAPRSLLTPTYKDFFYIMRK